MARWPGTAVVGLRGTDESRREGPREYAGRVSQASFFAPGITSHKGKQLPAPRPLLESVGPFPQRHTGSK